MELNDLEADEPSVKTQMTVIEKDQNLLKPTLQNETPKAQTPKTRLNKTLKNDQGRIAGMRVAPWVTVPNLPNRSISKKTQMQEEVKTATHLVLKRKTVTSAPTRNTTRRSGI